MPEAHAKALVTVDCGEDKMYIIMIVDAASCSNVDAVKAAIVAIGPGPGPGGSRCRLKI